MSSLFHSILSRLQDKISTETNLTETVAAIISTTIHTTITKDQISIRDTTLTIKSSATLKMAINLKREKILSALKDSNIKINTIR